MGGDLRVSFFLKLLFCGKRQFCCNTCRADTETSVMGRSGDNIYRISGIDDHGMLFALPSVKKMKLKKRINSFLKEMSRSNMSEEEISTKEKEQAEESKAAEVEAEQEIDEQNGDEEKDEKDLRIEELESELESAKDGMLRKAAELDNMRKRVQRERVQIFEEAKAGALEDFMPIADDLIRTLKAAEESEIEDDFLEGVKLVADKFQQVLEKHGVERIDETGVPFDVNLHDAMMKQPAPDDETGSDIVLQVMESGYKIGDRTIRHAKVIVSE